MSGQATSWRDVDLVLTADHSAIHPDPRVAEVRADDATPIPEGFEALGLDAFASRVGLRRRAAYYRLERLLGQQRDPDALRVVLLPVRTGKGARRLTRHVLWPVAA